MITVADAYLRFDRTANFEILEAAAIKLEEISEELLRQRLDDRYDIFQVAVIVRLETGSTRIWITVTALAGALIYYGDIRQSVELIIHDVGWFNRTIIPRVGPALGLNEAPARLEPRLGTPGRLKQLFDKVEAGELSADEAARDAQRIVSEEAERSESITVEAFAERINRELERLASIAREAHSLDGAVSKRARERPQRLPALPARPPRLRRRGVVAQRDPKTGRLTITRY